MTFKYNAGDAQKLKTPELAEAIVSIATPEYAPGEDVDTDAVLIEYATELAERVLAAAPFERKGV